MVAHRWHSVIHERARSVAEKTRDDDGRRMNINEPPVDRKRERERENPIRVTGKLNILLLNCFRREIFCLSNEFSQNENNEIKIV